MDAQDAQDNQDGTQQHERLTPAMIVCGFADVQDCKPAVFGKNPVHPVHPCESKIDSCLTLNRLPATRRKALFGVSAVVAPYTEWPENPQARPAALTASQKCFKCCAIPIACSFLSASFDSSVRCFREEFLRFKSSL